MYSLSNDYPDTLLAARQPPCLSIYQPTHRQHPDNAKDPIRFRKLVRQLAGSLRTKYPARDILELLRPFEALGEVILVPADRMPTDSGAAAISRF
jgi:hypothetical protein